MTPLYLSHMYGDGPFINPVKIVEWRRGPSPFKVTVWNMGTPVHLRPIPGIVRSFTLPGSETWPYPDLTVEVPAAIGGVDEIETEGLYFTLSQSRFVSLQLIVQPAAGCTQPTILDNEPPEGIHIGTIGGDDLG